MITFYWYIKLWYDTVDFILQDTIYHTIHKGTAQYDTVQCYTV